jgi:hypothetical protein
MATRRVTVDYVTSPNTAFYTDADLISQDQAGNFSTVYYWVGSINRGNTSSFYGSTGAQTATVGGAGGFGHSGTIPSGVGTNAQRWYDGPWGVNLGHDSAGNRGADTVAQTITWRWNRTDYGSIGPYPRIPKRPSVPGKPVASGILPTSLTMTWTASTDNAGSAIDNYLLRRWTGLTATGPYVDSMANNLTRLVTGLTPGTDYTFGVYAHNGSADNGGYSNVSAYTTVKTLAPLHVKVAGVWKYAVPYVKIGGVWTIGLPYVKVAGVWKATG